MLKTHSKGFTLIEILLAVGIFAATVIIFISSIAKSVEVSRNDEFLLQATILANNKMIELESEFQIDISRGKFPDEMSEAGAFEGDYSDYSWQYDVKKVEIPVVESGDQSAVLASALKNIMEKISESVRQVDLKVTWTDPADEESQIVVDLTTHIVDLK